MNVFRNISMIFDYFDLKMQLTLTICLNHFKAFVICSYNYNYLLKILVLFDNIIYYLDNIHLQYTYRETSKLKRRKHYLRPNY